MVEWLFVCECYHSALPPSVLCICGIMAQYHDYITAIHSAMLYFNSTILASLIYNGTLGLVNQSAVEIGEHSVWPMG